MNRARWGTIWEVWGFNFHKHSGDLENENRKSPSFASEHIFQQVGYLRRSRTRAAILRSLRISRIIRRSRIGDSDFERFSRSCAFKWGECTKRTEKLINTLATAHLRYSWSQVRREILAGWLFLSNSKWWKTRLWKSVLQRANTFLFTIFVFVSFPLHCPFRQRAYSAIALRTLGNRTLNSVRSARNAVRHSGPRFAI